MKLAEEYHGKMMECSAHIESCVPEVHDLIAKLSTCNTQFVSSAGQSLGSVRSSVGALLSAESSSRPIISVGTAVQEVEQIKMEQMQLCQRYDRLLAILQMGVQQMDQSGDAAQFQLQNFAAAANDTTLFHSPDTSGVGANAGRGITPEDDDTPAMVMLPFAADQFYSNSVSDIMMPRASGAVVTDSSSAQYAARSGNRRRGRGARSVSAGRAAGFRTPRGRPRRLQVISAAVRANSADNFLPSAVSNSADTLPPDVSNSADTSSLPSAVSEPATGGETGVVKPRRQRRSKSAAPIGGVGNFGVVGNNAGVVRPDNFDDAVPSDSVDAPVQSAAVTVPFPAGRSSEPEGVKTRGRRRTKSAAQNDVASSEKTTSRPTVGRLLSGRGRSYQRRRVTADVDGVETVKSRRPRSSSVQVAARGRRRKGSGSPTKVVQSPTATTTTSTTSFDATDNFPSTSASPTSPRRPVTTWLSGRRTDIFGQYSPQSSPSAAPTSNGIVQSVDAVDDEVSFGPAVHATTTMPVSANRWVTALVSVCTL